MILADETASALVLRVGGDWMMRGELGTDAEERVGAQDDDNKLITFCVAGGTGAETIVDDDPGRVPASVLEASGFVSREIRCFACKASSSA